MNYVGRYVGRWDNGSAYMEWAGRPVGSIAEAKAQVQQDTGIYCDVVEVLPGNGLEDCEGSTIVSRSAGGEWVTVF